MKKERLKQIVSDALIHRGFSEVEATKLIKLLTTPVKNQTHTPVNKTIDVYV
jgi:hypothetical protein